MAAAAPSSGCAGHGALHAMLVQGRQESAITMYPGHRLAEDHSAEGWMGFRKHKVASNSYTLHLERRKQIVLPL